MQILYQAGKCVKRMTTRRSESCGPARKTKLRVGAGGKVPTARRSDCQKEREWLRQAAFSKTGKPGREIRDKPVR